MGLELLVLRWWLPFSGSLYYPSVFMTASLAFYFTSTQTGVPFRGLCSFPPLMLFSWLLG
jgi:hypothetical protein